MVRDEKTLFYRRSFLSLLFFLRYLFVYIKDLATAVSTAVRADPMSKVRCRTFLALR